MRSKSVIRALCVSSALALLSATGAVAQEQAPSHLHGLINDYVPSSVKGGPWEMHGAWSMDLHRSRWSETADFTAAMTMSDYVVVSGVPDATQGGQGAHTHHIRLMNARIIWNMTGCPTFSPVTTTGFQINGTVSLITGNGSNAPFETVPPSSTLQICVTGASETLYSVSNSNITLVFGGPATSHFGSQPIHGVVRNAEPAGEAGHY